MLQLIFAIWLVVELTSISRIWSSSSTRHSRWSLRETDGNWVEIVGCNLDAVAAAAFTLFFFVMGNMFGADDCEESRRQELQ